MVNLRERRPRASNECSSVSRINSMTHTPGSGGRDIPEIRGLSLWEPWAFLMAVDEKRFETRSWATPYRGTVAIHASKNLDELELCLTDPFCDALKRHGIQKVGDL